MLRFVITIATAVTCIASADLANADAQKTKKVYIEKISKGARGQAAPAAFVVEPQPITPKDELYGVACVTPFKTAFSCPGGGM